MFCRVIKSNSWIPERIVLFSIVMHIIFRRIDSFEPLVILLAVFLFCSCDRLSVKVDVSDIPNYYFENQYLDNRTETINKAIGACTDGYIAFFWITDIHWEPDLNMRKAPLLIKYIASKTGINRVLNGGDTGNSQVICKNAMSQLKNAVPWGNVYSVTGNHEINDASRYERPFFRVAGMLRGHNTDIVYGDNNKSYFYFDDEVGKTRFVGLSAYGLFLNDSYVSHYTKEQLEWFNSMALNVEEGWTIVVFTHALYAVAATDELYVAPSGAKEFIDAIDNYKGKGTIACVLIGHSHRDRIHIGSTGVPYIISACDRHAAYHGDINVERVPCTVSEQHFEVVVIDKSKRQIELLSVGANARDGYDNDPGLETGVRILNY